MHSLLTNGSSYYLYYCRRNNKFIIQLKQTILLYILFVRCQFVECSSKFFAIKSSPIAPINNKIIIKKFIIKNRVIQPYLSQDNDVIRRCTNRLIINKNLDIQFEDLLNFSNKLIKNISHSFVCETSFKYNISK